MLVTISNEHFVFFFGSEEEVRLYRAREGKKEYVGRLSTYESGGVVLDTAEGAVTFEKKDIAQVRLYVRF